ncbi:MAG: MBL fold metallo-hydrolase [Methanolinea sp.]|nr:MBL fold metallo-hydrolase [Methanolinea sp.]
MPVRWIPGGGFLGNSYLVGDVLVDAGVTPTGVERYRDRIQDIVLTHCHFDHIAYINEIALMCNARVHIHGKDAPGLSSDTMSLSLHFGARAPMRPPDRVLAEGDRVGDLLVIHTPGHTPGSICLLHEDEGALISGDTVFSDGGFGRFDFPGGSRSELQNSLERLAHLEIEGLYPGHGSPVEKGGRRHIIAALDLLRMTYD